MEHGFYHPDRGYWQANSDVPRYVRDGYPAGTVEVPLRPIGNFDWAGQNGLNCRLTSKHWAQKPAANATPYSHHPTGLRLQTPLLTNLHGLPIGRRCGTSRRRMVSQGTCLGL
jgi:hypothetical protein